MRISLIAVLFFLFSYASAQVNVQVFPQFDVLNVEAATAVLDVTYTRETDPTVLEDPIDFNTFQMVVIMIEDLETLVDPAVVQTNLENFANAGGTVLILGKSLSDGDNLLSVVGGTSIATCTRDETTPPSNATECNPINNGGFSDFRGRTMDYYTSARTLFFLGQNLNCLGIGENSFTPCFEDASGQTAFSARPMSNGGGIYFMTSGGESYYYEERNVNAGLFFEGFNNLLVSAGANTLDLSGFPDVNVLFLIFTNEDYRYYYTNAFVLAAHDNATITVGGAELFPEIGNYDVVIWSSSNYYYPQFGYVGTMSDDLITYVTNGGVLLNAIGGGFGYSNSYNSMPALFGIDDYFYCDDWDGDDPYFTFDDFSTDAACDPLLNGGFEDLTGLSPETDFQFGYTKLMNNVVSCMEPSTATTCLTANDKAIDGGFPERSTVWAVNEIGTEGGIAVTMNFGYGTESFLFATSFYRSAFNNLLVYAITKDDCTDGTFLFEDECVAECPDGTYGDGDMICQACDESCATCANATSCITCPVENNSVLWDDLLCRNVLIEPFSNRTWSIYYQGCISWDAAVMNPGETGTFTLQSGFAFDDEQVLISDVILDGGSVEIKIFGVSPSSESARIEAVFGSREPIYSEVFILTGPSDVDGVDNPCATVITP